MKTTFVAIKISFLIILGATLQNISWYLRLQKPILLREFEMYWAEDGARLFLDFNGINYFFLMITTVILIIFYLIRKHSQTHGKVSQ